MINVSDILLDQDFATVFTVVRSRGVFARGGFQSTTQTFLMRGVVNTASGDDLAQIPAADRVASTNTFYSLQPLYLTRPGPAAGLSDLLIWGGDTYRVSSVNDRSVYGYFIAIGVRMAGD